MFIYAENIFEKEGCDMRQWDANIIFFFGLGESAVCGQSL